jgi:F0F1-type ATP synthase epsilon subunit
MIIDGEIFHGPPARAGADSTWSAASTTAIRAKDLDEVVAKKAKEDAERALANRGDAMEIAQAQARLAEAMAQLQALERLRKNLKH